MFCPKCGSNLPDQAKFCTSCGATLTPKTAPGPMPSSDASNRIPHQMPVGKTAFKSSGAGAAIGGQSLSAMTLAGIILAAIALIFALLPWFYTNPTYQSISSVASFFSGSSSYQLEESYSVWQLMSIGEVASEADEAADELSSLYSSSSSSGRASAVGITNPEYTPISVSFFFALYFVGWLIGFVVIVIGAIVLFVGKKKSPVLMAIGLIVLAIVAIIYTISYSGGMTTLAEACVPTNAVICFLAALVGAVCAVKGRSKIA